MQMTAMRSGRLPPRIPGNRLTGAGLCQSGSHHMEDIDMKKVLALALVLVMVFALCACGGKSLAGTWELTAMKSGGEDYTEMLQASGVKVILQLNEDGSGYIDFGGDKEDLTWDKDGITSDGVKIPYTTDGKTLTISEGGEEMTFTRK